MKIDFNTVILNVMGEPMLNQEQVAVTLRDVVQGALLASLDGDQRLNGSAKANLFRLAIQANAPDADIPVKDISIIMERVGAACTPLVVGRAFEILDPPPEPLGADLHP